MLSLPRPPRLLLAGKPELVTLVLQVAQRVLMRHILSGQRDGQRPTHV